MQSLNSVSWITGILILYSDITFKQSTDNPYNVLELNKIMLFSTSIMTLLWHGSYALKLWTLT